MKTIILFIIFIFFTSILLYNFYYLFNIYEGHETSDNDTFDNLKKNNESNTQDIERLNTKYTSIKTSSNKLKTIEKRMKNNGLEIIKISDKVKNMSSDFVGGDPVKVAKKSSKIKGTGLNDDEYDTMKKDLTPD